MSGHCVQAYDDHRFQYSRETTAATLIIKREVVPTRSMVHMIILGEITIPHEYCPNKICDLVFFTFSGFAMYPLVESTGQWCMNRVVEYDVTVRPLAPWWWVSLDLANQLLNEVFTFFWSEQTFEFINLHPSFHPEDSRHR